MRSLVRLLPFVPALLLLAGSTAGAPRSPETSPESGTRLSISRPTPEIGGDGWWEAVSARIALEEYHASVSEAGLQAPNRNHDFRICFGADGIALVPRAEPETGKSTWRLAWTTTGWGRDGNCRAIGAASITSTDNRVVYARPGIDEWYVNAPDGLEQGFTVRERPAGPGELKVAGRFDGTLQAHFQEAAVLFVDDGNTSMFRYAKLLAWDAFGNPLPARLDLSGTELAILVDDRDATYPITIDPVITSTNWPVNGGQTGARFGIAAGTAGDVNGDGYSDVIIGADQYDNGQLNEGRAFLFLGSATGLTDSPSWTVDGDQPSCFMGTSVGTAGDVNGDGYDDIVVGAPNYDLGATDEGLVFVFYGSPTGPPALSSWVKTGLQGGAEFGLAAGTAGDVNGDGYDDLLVGARSYDNGQVNEGRAFVFHGSSSGLAAGAAWTGESDQANAGYGVTVSTAGDVNADGYDDVIIGGWFYDNGQTDEGAAWVYHGSAAGLAAAPAWFNESNQAGAGYGGSVSLAGDVNGDGYGDVVVGALNYDNGQTNEGRVYAYHGSATGLSAAPNWFFESDQAGAVFGARVASAGDFDGDGYADVFIGSSLYVNGGVAGGAAFRSRGSWYGLINPVQLTPGPVQADARRGYAGGVAGDVNGDGFSDLVIGSFNYDGSLVNEGRADMVYGAGERLAGAWGWSTESVVDDPNQTGWACNAAGDINGDGFSDIVVGNEHYDNDQPDEGIIHIYFGSRGDPVPGTPASIEGNIAYAQFGTVVGSAGDVNGDGYSDVIVTAPTYDNERGAAYVFLGSSAGLWPTPVWGAGGESFGSLFGFQAGSAGDLNGDGFGDIVVAAPWYPGGAARVGKVYAYLGSPSGPATTPVWTTTGTQPTEQLGYAAGTAGDVNRDGYSDLVVASPYYDIPSSPHIGHAFVFHGSAAGPAATPSWTFESSDTYPSVGVAAGASGDVNGDGYSDVFLARSDALVTWIFHGSASGLGPVPPSLVFGTGAHYAGDVNGDGYSDVATSYDSATDYLIMVYGSASGLDGGNPHYCGAAPLWNRPPRSAGDVNGDGFSDLVYTETQPLGEAVRVNYGNSRATGGVGGPDRRPRQLRSLTEAPLHLLGKSDVESGFRIRVRGRTALGRNTVRLQYEVKPFGVAFNGTGLVTGPSFDTGAPGATGSGVDLTEVVAGLTTATRYHWRARILADSPLIPRTSWLGPAGNAPSELDLATAAAPSGVADLERPGRPPLLESAAPNPFSGTTRLAFTLPARGRVRLAAYDVTGREVAILTDELRDAGAQVATWDGRGRRGEVLPAGVYWIRIEYAGQVSARKVVLAR